MNQKPFDPWNDEKQMIDQIDQKILFRESEVWWVKLGINVGIEQNGKGDDFSRPVLVLRKYNNRHCLIVPLTTKQQSEKFSFHLDPNISFLKKESWIVFSQIRVMDSRRLFEKMGKLPDPIFDSIKKEAREKIFPFTSD
ncbi:type II toxin-antitoxin system PemK/MazF family toxin [Candidatus Gracilibacteria bacterium]|nr:type II toxin-antitoxin system PemK/MazF family toxin [Candidatus Gracilibacteria bacterium]